MLDRLLRPCYYAENAQHLVCVIGKHTMTSSLDQVRELALANFDALLNHWNLDYKKLTEYEYDIIATWREDHSFGGCRFNLKKARGADFAGGGLTKKDISELNLPFGPEDYAGYTPEGQGKIGFDIVGLTQRVYKCPNYVDAVGRLNSDLDTIAQSKTLTTPHSSAAMRREIEYREQVKKSKRLALDMWESCKYHNFEGSVGEKYLLNRHKIIIRDDSMRFHPGLLCKVNNIWKKFPALIFKVQNNPLGPLEAIHRIFLSDDGYKADIDNPKMALAPVKGLGIWLGKQKTRLALTEGPENALTLRQIGYNFVCCSVFGTNLHNISIPPYVTNLDIFPDPDKAGERALELAMEVYTKLPIKVEAILLKNTGNLDLNDQLRDK